MWAAPRHNAPGGHEGTLNRQEAGRTATQDSNANRQAGRAARQGTKTDRHAGMQAGRQASRQAGRQGGQVVVLGLCYSAMCETICPTAKAT